MNRIVSENRLPGTPRHEWDIVPPHAYYDTHGLRAGDPTIEGFSTDISVALGQTVFFKVNTMPATTHYRIDIYRLGYYGGCGARLITTIYPDVAVPQVQPAPILDPVTGMVECVDWQVSAHWQVPAELLSGVYLARLQRLDGIPGANHIPFIVRDDQRSADLLFQTSDTTWQAYNYYGGTNLYRWPTHPQRRAYKVSYNRPFLTRVDEVKGVDFIKSWLFNAEYPAIRWLERNGYDLHYCSGIDTDRYGPHMLSRYRAFLSVGHDEYWSGPQRMQVEAARDRGMHLAFLSGNEVFWKVRWEPGYDGTAYRTMVCYKESREGQKLDPRPDQWTGTWRDPRFSPPADGGYPENALTGTIFMVNNHYQLYPIEVSAEEGRLRFWRHTDLAELPDGARVSLSHGLLGWEWDCDLDNGYRPEGLMRLSTTSADNVPTMRDFGSAGAWDYKQATHHLTLYRHSSGAYVFGAGTMNWAWGLDAEHDLQQLDAQGQCLYPADLRVQQATVNVLADMSIQPESLQSELVATYAPRPASPPIVLIRAPRLASRVGLEQLLRVEGAAQSATRQVAAVEYSVDGGARWHPATGRNVWFFQVLPQELGNLTLLCRAVDDAGQIGPVSSVVVEVALFERER